MAESTAITGFLGDGDAAAPVRGALLLLLRAAAADLAAAAALLPAAAFAAAVSSLSAAANGCAAACGPGEPVCVQRREWVVCQCSTNVIDRRAPCAPVHPLQQASMRAAQRSAWLSKQRVARRDADYLMLHMFRLTM